MRNLSEPQARTNVVEFLHDLPHREPKNAENFKSDTYLDGLITLGCVAAGIGIIIMILYAVSRFCCRRRCAKRLDTVSRDRLLWRLGFGFLVAGILAVLIGALAGVNARRHVRHFNNRVGDLEEVVIVAQEDINGAKTDLREIEAATNQISCVDDIQEELLKVVREANKILKKGQKEVDDLMYPVNRARRKIHMVNHNFIRYMPVFFVACLGLFVFCAAFGIGASFASKSRSVTWSGRCALCMGNYWASWIALPVAAIVIGAALMFSVAGADFCHMGPTNVITAMGDRNVYLAYYLQCEGENPMLPTYEAFKAIYHVMDAAFKQVIPVAEENGICTGPPDAFADILAALDDIGRLIDEGGTLLSCDSVEPLAQKLTYDSFCDEIVQTLFLIWLVLGIGGLLTLVALCIAPCVTPALFPEDDAEDDAEDKYGEDPEEAKERDSVSSEDGAAPAGDEPAWHGSSVEADDLWPQTQEVSPRSMEL